jgi:DNA end-binding protein Ku
MAEPEEETGPPRAFWSGTITFGLVSIPVELYPANRSQRVSLRMVSPDGVPLARRFFCPKDNRELDEDEIVRGYEIEKDTYVVVTDDELEKLAPERTRDIDLRLFVDAADIDVKYFERAYYLTPGGNSTKAYRLLAATMEQTGRAGIATFVMRGKEYLIAILAENGILRAETLRFPEEIRAPEDVGLPEPKKPKAAAVKAVEKAVAALRESELDEDELTDQGAQRLLQLVSRKEKSGEDVVQAAGASVAASDDVIDLMEVLKRSLQGGSGAGASKPKRSGAAKAGAGGGGKSKTPGTASSRRSTSAASSKRLTRAASNTKDALESQSRDKLYQRAQKLDIPGRSSMSKDELIEAIRRGA